MGLSPFWFTAPIFFFSLSSCFHPSFFLCCITSVNLLLQQEPTQSSIRASSHVSSLKKDFSGILQRSQTPIPLTSSSLHAEAHTHHRSLRPGRVPRRHSRAGAACPQGSPWQRRVWCHSTVPGLCGSSSSIRDLLTHFLLLALNSRKQRGCSRQDEGMRGCHQRGLAPAGAAQAQARQPQRQSVGLGGACPSRPEVFQGCTSSSV